MNGWLVTGTDTGVGKTRISVALLRNLRQQGQAIVPMKPVASGAEMISGKLRNDDAVLLQQAYGESLPDDLLNPYCFAPAIAPHLAARQAGVEMELTVIRQAAEQLLLQHDRLLVEGAGGWAVPLGHDWGFAELARALNLEVILVVGIRLGCINHARLTEAAIAASGLHCAGWIANSIAPDPVIDPGSIDSLHQFLRAPCLAICQSGSQPDWTESGKSLLFNE